MLTARVHNALVRRIRCWTRFAARLDPRLVDLLHADRAAVAVLAGVPGTAVVEAPDDAVAADLLVLLDHLDLHAGTRLSVTPLGSLRYRVHGTGAGDRPAALRLTADVRAGRPVGYLPWPGRIERVAVITRDRPAILSEVLDAWAGNLRRFGHEADLVVYDDSGPDHRDEVRALVEARGARYVGPDEKHALRAELEPRLPGGGPRRSEVLDALLGRREADGTWTGSAAAQRNWAILSAPGSRVLVCDDDVRPAVLDAPLDALRAAARNATAVDDHVARRPGDLIEEFLRTADVEARPTDLLGLLEDTDARLASAAYTGHPDRRTALWLERFLEPGEDSVDVLGTGIRPQRVRRGEPAATGRRFRGGAFASSGSLDGLEFAVRRGRNEDFSLALGAEVTSQGRRLAVEAAGAHLLHLRGPRATSTFTAHREEREGYLVNAVVRRIADAYAVTHRGPFDGGAFRAFGRANLDAALDREPDVGGEVFDEGLAYRDRARGHLDELVDTPWFADRTEVRVGLLRQGIRSVRATVVPDHAVLMECAQVLVPQGLLATLDPPAMRRAWSRLSDVERAEAARCLADEVRYLRSVTSPPAEEPVEERIARKAEQTRRLIDHLERELGVAPSATAGEIALARGKFRADVRRRVREEVALYLDAVPYVPPVRAELARVTRPAVGVTP